MRFVCAWVLVAALAANASGNGRAPGTSTLHFRQGHETTDILAGLTFGLVVTHDGGATWRWMCEAAVGYGGLYDPDYSYSASSAIFATTFNGFKVTRDGCTFAATSPGMTFVAQDELGPDGALYIGAADSADSDISKSVDDGMTFPTATTPGQLNDWWQSLIVAPGNANVVFLAGYRFVATQKVLLVFKSTNGGSSFVPLPGNLANDGAASTSNASLVTSANSTMDLVGVSGDGGTLYARITYESANAPSDGLYKLDTASGTTWTRILGLADSMATVVRSNGDIVVITKTLGGQTSSNGGTTWTPLSNPPHANCLVENPVDHSIWACTQNYGTPGDGYGIMKTSDLTTWSGVLRYQDIQGPVSCAAGTPQYDTCTPMWPGLCAQLAITSPLCTPGVDGAPDGAPVDGAPDAGSGMHVRPPPGPCGCGSGSGGATTALAGAAVVATLLLRRRRRGGRQ
jgi:MYXO-CTERM domain-containing protein